MNILLASPVAKKIDSATLAGNKYFILVFEKSCGASLHFSLKGFGQVLKKSKRSDIESSLGVS